MKRNRDGNSRKAAEKAGKENVHARNSGVEPELSTFDYSVDRVDRAKFNESKRKLIDHVSKTYGKAVRIIEREEHVQFTPPVPPSEEEIEMLGKRLAGTKYSTDYASYRRQVDAYEETKPKLYGLLWAQCTTAMRNQLKSDENWSYIDNSKDPLYLWKLIQEISLSGSTAKQNTIKKKVEATFRFNRFRQFKTETVGDFYERFQDEYDIYKSNGGCLADPGRIDLETAFETEEEKQEYISIIESETQLILAMNFIEKLDRTRYGRMQDELQNLYDRGQDSYPTTLVDAYHMAVNRRDEGSFADTLIQPKSDIGAAFATNARKGKEKKGD